MRVVDWHGEWWRPRGKPGAGAAPLRGRAALAGLLLWIATVGTAGAFVVQVGAPTVGGLVTLQRRHRAIAARPAEIATTPLAADTDFGTQRAPLASRFQDYYHDHAGETQLGAAITPALPVAGGWLQFYQAGALAQAGAAPVQVRRALADGASAASDPAHLTVPFDGERDAATGVIALPLMAALLNAGSQLAISSAEGPTTLTYAALRQVIQANTLVPAPAWYRPNQPQGPDGAFVPVTHISQGSVLGRLVPLSFWRRLTQPASAPDGWLTDDGMPLTGAIPTITTVHGVTRHLLLQAFAHAVLVAEITPGGTAGIAQPILAGVDYLRTFGPPPVPLAATHAWVTTATAIQQAPGAGSVARAQVGAGFPLRLTGGARWMNGALWYQAAWGPPHASGTGWLPATAAGFAAPVGSDPASADFDALDPALASYLAGYGSNVGTVAYDVTRGVMYTYNAGSQFITASSIKVPILLALLAQTETEGREPDGNETAALTLMIEDSDNVAAQQLYEEIGDAPGMSAFMARIGVSGLAAAPGAWGWSTITPRAMAQVLVLLQAGRILTPADRALALDLLRQVEPDQRAGVGDTAPAGAAVALKDGWVTGPDGLWDVNTSGIVTVGSETYILTVYTTDDEGGYADGAAILDHICAAVARDLT